MQESLDKIQHSAKEAIEEIKFQATTARLNLVTHSENLKMIPDVLAKIQEIHDRLELIENCLKNEGMMEEVVE